MAEVNLGILPQLTPDDEALLQAMYQVVAPSFATDEESAVIDAARLAYFADVVGGVDSQEAFKRLEHQELLKTVSSHRFDMSVQLKKLDEGVEAAHSWLHTKVPRISLTMLPMLDSASQGNPLEVYKEVEVAAFRRLIERALDEQRFPERALGIAGRLFGMEIGLIPVPEVQGGSDG